MKISHLPFGQKSPSGIRWYHRALRRLGLRSPSHFNGCYDEGFLDCLCDEGPWLTEAKRNSLRGVVGFLENGSAVVGTWRRSP